MVFRKISNNNVLVILAGLGILLRIKVFFENRSLMIDEANLARNIIEKNYSALFQSLEYEQFAPPLFSVATKALTELFGVHELILKLPVLTSGIISILLLVLILKRLPFPDPVRWYLMLIFVFSILGLRYSTEFKQYAVDVALTLAFVLWSLRSENTRFRSSHIVQWSAAGAVAIWTSMPIVFVLTAIAITFLYRSWRTNKTILTNWLIPAVTWAVSFTIYFTYILYDETQREGLAHYHHPYYFDFFPTSNEALAQSLKLIQGLLKSATDPTFLALIWAVITTATGMVVLLRRNKFILITLFLPILFTLIASDLEFYSLVDRLSLFLLPLIILIIGFGLSFLWSISTRWTRILLVAVMLISVANKLGFRYFWKTMEFEASKEVLTFIATKEGMKDLIFVHSDGVPAFVFYNDLHDKSYEFPNYYLSTWDEEPGKNLIEKALPENVSTFWLFYAHTYPQETIDRHIDSCAAFARVVDNFVSQNASTYRFSLE